MNHSQTNNKQTGFFCADNEISIRNDARYRVERDQFSTINLNL